MLFTQFASHIVETIQNQTAPITEHIEEQQILCGVTYSIRYKSNQRNELVGNLGTAENAIQAFYHCLEGRPIGSEEAKYTVSWKKETSPCLFTSFDITLCR